MVIGAGALVVLLVLATGAFLALRTEPRTRPAILLAADSTLRADSTVAIAPAVVREAYRFAVANPEPLSQIPCYCACGGVGHESNLDCFIQAVEPDGSVTFDHHALA